MGLVYRFFLQRPALSGMRVACQVECLAAARAKFGRGGFQALRVQGVVEVAGTH